MNDRLNNKIIAFYRCKDKDGNYLYCYVTQYSSGKIKYHFTQDYNEDSKIGARYANDNGYTKENIKNIVNDKPNRFNLNCNSVEDILNKIQEEFPKTKNDVNKNNFYESLNNYTEEKEEEDKKFSNIKNKIKDKLSELGLKIRNFNINKKAIATIGALVAAGVVFATSTFVLKRNSGPTFKQPETETEIETEIETENTNQKDQDENTKKNKKKKNKKKKNKNNKKNETKDEESVAQAKETENDVFAYTTSSNTSSQTSTSENTPVVQASTTTTQDDSNDKDTSSKKKKKNKDKKDKNSKKNKNKNNKKNKNKKKKKEDPYKNVYEEEEKAKKSKKENYSQVIEVEAKEETPTTENTSTPAGDENINPDDVDLNPGLDENKGAIDDDLTYEHEEPYDKNATENVTEIDPLPDPNETAVGDYVTSYEELEEQVQETNASTNTSESTSTSDTTMDQNIETVPVSQEQTTEATATLATENTTTADLDTIASQAVEAMANGEEGNIVFDANSGTYSFETTTNENLQANGLTK